MIYLFSAYSRIYERFQHVYFSGSKIYITEFVVNRNDITTTVSIMYSNNIEIVQSLNNITIDTNYPLYIFGETEYSLYEYTEKRIHEIIIEKLEK